MSAGSAPLGRIVVGGPAARQQVADALADLDEVERAFLATVTSVLLDPAMSESRRRLREGEITLAIEGDEVTWIDTDQVGAELVHRLSAMGGV